MQDLYQQLGFEPVRRKIASYAVTENGKKYAETAGSFLPKETYEERQTRTLEMRDLLALDKALPLIAFPAQSETIKKLTVEGSLLNEKELWTIAVILRHGRLNRNYFEKRKNKYSALEELVRAYDPGLEKLEKSIVKIFDEEKNIADNASSALHALRRNVAKTERSINEKVRNIAGKWLKDGIAQDDSVAFRNGRQVIPIRASRRAKAPGIIHDQSQTGQTVYIEPMVIVEMNNELYQARREERNEIRRILIKKTDEIRPFLSPLRDVIHMMEVLDFLQASAKLALDYRCDKPVFVEDLLRIKNGRNLELHFSREPVPLNLSLSEKKRGIIITGPNAGGKTVALKTIGLLALMNQAGFLIPAEAATSLPQFDHIFVDIGDKQSIDGGLSTFSSHILSLKHILENAGPESLVLIDELGTGTDPDEGAALAEGVLKILSERGATVIATTHHGALKILAFEDPLFENGSMSFNDRNLEPTYEFIPRIPGSSYALEIAKRYKLDENVIRHARERLGKQREKLERLIVDLQRKIARYDSLLRETREKAEDYQNKLRTIEESKKDIDRKHKRAEKDAMKRAEAMVTNLRKELEANIRSIRESEASKASIKEAQGSFRNAEKMIKEKAHKEHRSSEKELELRDLRIGMPVYIKSMQQNGKVLEINPKTNKVWVDVDGSRLRLQPGWLEPARRTKQKTHSSAIYSQHTSNYHLDLRGKRAEEALKETDKFIDNAVLSGLYTLEILHGTGQGILQKVIHDFLSKDPRVLRYDFAPPEQGGTGVTYVFLHNA